MRTGLSASYGSLSRTAASPHSAVRGSTAGLLDRESPVLSHTIFRRPLGSRISFVCLYPTGITYYRREAGLSHWTSHEPLLLLQKSLKQPQALGLLSQLNHVAQRHPLQMRPRWCGRYRRRSRWRSQRMQEKQRASVT